VAWLTWAVGQVRAGAGGGHGRMMGADRLWARVRGACGGGQAKLVMSCQGHGLVAYGGGRTDGRVQAIPPQSSVSACDNKKVFVTLIMLSLRHIYHA